MAVVEMGRERRSKSKTTHEARGDRSGLKIESRFCFYDFHSRFDFWAGVVRTGSGDGRSRKDSRDRRCEADFERYYSR